MAGRGNRNRLGTRGQVKFCHVHIVAVVVGLALLRAVGARWDEDGRCRTGILLVAHGAADETFLGDGHSTKHRAELLQERDKVRVKFGEDVFIADDLGQIPRTDLSKPARLPGRVHSPAREKGGNGGVLPTTGFTARAVLLLSALLFFLEALGGTDNTRCNATECAPDDGARPERSSSVFAGQGYQGITAPFAARHRIRETEDVGNRVAGHGIAEANRAGGQTTGEKLAAQGANGGFAEERIVMRLGRAPEREVGEDVSVTGCIGGHGGRAQGIWRRSMEVRVDGVVVGIRVAIAAGIYHLSRSQNGTRGAAFGGARGTGGQLLAHILGERKAAAGACVTVGAAVPVRPVFGRGWLGT